MKRGVATGMTNSQDMGLQFGGCEINSAGSGWVYRKRKYQLQFFRWKSFVPPTIEYSPDFNPIELSFSACMYPLLVHLIKYN